MNSIPPELSISGANRMQHRVTWRRDAGGEFVGSHQPARVIDAGHVINEAVGAGLIRIEFGRQDDVEMRLAT